MRHWPTIIKRLITKPGRQAHRNPFQSDLLLKKVWHYNHVVHRLDLLSRHFLFQLKLGQVHHLAQNRPRQVSYYHTKRYLISTVVILTKANLITVIKVNFLFHKQQQRYFQCAIEAFMPVTVNKFHFSYRFHIDACSTTSSTFKIYTQTDSFVHK